MHVYTCPEACMLGGERCCATVQSNPTASRTEACGTASARPSTTISAWAFSKTPALWQREAALWGGSTLQICCLPGPLRIASSSPLDGPSISGSEISAVVGMRIATPFSGTGFAFCIGARRHMLHGACCWPPRSSKLTLRPAHGLTIFFMWAGGVSAARRSGRVGDSAYVVAGADGSSLAVAAAAALVLAA